MSCAHLRKVDAATLTSLLQEFFKILSTSKQKSREKLPLADGANGGRPNRMEHALVCLSCNTPVESSRRDCAQSEAHRFGVNVAFHQLYCFACKDYVYHKDFDAVRCLVLGKFDAGVGLRGVCNLGNTCFMNSVLQSLANVESIREYFLSKEHNQSCSVARRAKLVAARLQTAAAKAAIQKPNGRGQAHTRMPRRPAKRAKVAAKSEESKTQEESQNGSTTRMAFRYAELWDRPWYKHSDKAMFSGKSRVGALTTYFPEPTSPKSKQLLAERDSEIPVCIACEFENFIGNMYAGSKSEKPLVLSDLLYGVWQHSSILRGYAQQDAHEFFSFIVNSVHGHLRNEMRIKKLVVPTVDQTNGAPSARITNKTTFCDCTIHQALGGQLCSEVQCGSCGEISASFEDFFDVSLDIALEMGQNTQVSVESLMNRFIQTERLVDKIKCEQCGSNQDALKRLSVFKVPRIFVLHLKRFRQGLTLAECIKMNQFVEFKMENFDITAHMHSKAKATPKPMTLISVIQHSGKNLDSGHYIAYIRHRNHWFKCNDDCISQVSEEEVKNCQAYLLFYQQTD